MAGHDAAIRRWYGIPVFDRQVYGIEIEVA
jgi:hypothetical protein